MVYEKNMSIKKVEINISINETLLDPDPVRMQKNLTNKTFCFRDLKE